MSTIPCLDIATLQSEYSRGIRELKIALLEKCKRLSVAFLAFDPLGRGFLSTELNESDFTRKDVCRLMPRFQPV